MSADSKQDDLKYTCPDCGSVLNKKNLSTHRKTKKHLAALGIGTDMPKPLKPLKPKKTRGSRENDQIEETKEESEEDDEVSYDAEDDEFEEALTVLCDQVSNLKGEMNIIKKALKDKQLL